MTQNSRLFQENSVEKKPARLLIAGSREASPEMLALAKRKVTQGELIIVGDNPKGVDAAVIEECDRLCLELLVFGITLQPRKGSNHSSKYQQVKVPKNISAAEAYRLRNRQMIDYADHCIFIHNGNSPGTKAGYEYAKSLGKSAEIFVL